MFHELRAEFLGSDLGVTRRASMRIAFSGTHRVGKSTLIADLAERLSGYRLVDEPYAILEAGGYEFNHPPSLEDFVEQLRCSVTLLGDASADTLFDRCPLDFLAYIAAHPERDAFDGDEWAEQIAAAIRTLDLIVFVPIEGPAPRTKDSRRKVDAKLQRLLFEGDLDIDVLTVTGTRLARVEQVLRHTSRPV